jgi:hypothetical protein
MFPVTLPFAKYIYLYPKPINMQWGKNKLTEICTHEMGINPTNNDFFLFFNREKDKLKLFFLDADGSQEITKILPKGGFMMPVAMHGEKYIRLEASKLQSLFRC